MVDTQLLVLNLDETIDYDEIENRDDTPEIIGMVVAVVVIGLIIILIIIAVMSCYLKHRQIRKSHRKYI